MITNNVVHIIDFPKILDDRGNLSFFENEAQIPFNIKRTYWIYDVPGGKSRGSHAFKTQAEVIVAMSGSFDVTIDTGTEEKIFQLNRSYYGLYIPPMTWRHIKNFSTNSLALIVNSGLYDVDDYIRDFATFKSMIK
jgi:dTDP-4-dehydrorhamnose 3,5-epimerase-like enzyme